jgi:hypothetical protein
MTGILETVSAALAGPSLSLQLDLRGANCCNCCNRTNSDDFVVVVGNTIQPRTLSCWEKVFGCCGSNKARIRGKEAVEQYFKSVYDSETATQAFAQAHINFNQINSISTKEIRKIQQTADQLMKEEAEKQHGFLREQIEDHRPSDVFTKKPEEEKQTEKMTQDELRRERNLVCHTLKGTQFNRPITEVQIEEVANKAIQNAALENGETITVQKIRLKVMEQLKKEGYVIARSPRSPIGKNTFQPPTPTPSPHHDLQV